MFHSVQCVFIFRYNDQISRDAFWVVPLAFQQCLIPVCACACVCVCYWHPSVPVTDYTHTAEIETDTASFAILRLLLVLLRPSCHTRKGQSILFFFLKLFLCAGPTFNRFSVARCAVSKLLFQCREVSDDVEIRKFQNPARDVCVAIGISFAEL